MVLGEIQGPADRGWRAAIQRAAAVGRDAADRQAACACIDVFRWHAAPCESRQCLHRQPSRHVPGTCCDALHTSWVRALGKELHVVHRGVFVARTNRPLGWTSSYGEWCGSLCNDANKKEQWWSLLPTVWKKRTCCVRARSGGLFTSTWTDDDVAMVVCAFVYLRLCSVCMCGWVDSSADQIAILSSGRLRALGTSLFLKSHFGAGYNISLECKPRDQAEVEQLVKGLLHGASVMSPVPGSLTVALPRRCMRALPNFFRQCEAGQGGVTSFSVSNTTLEGAYAHMSGASTRCVV
mgnify:CR=1 FL=1